MFAEREILSQELSRHDLKFLSTLMIIKVIADVILKVFNANTYFFIYCSFTANKNKNKIS